MPDSMFGRPSQHLLPSHPPASAGGSSVASDPHTTPVQPAPLTFKDFRFNSIGKQPELLSRISLPQPDQTEYHSPTPSPTSTPPPVFTNNGAFQSKSSSRPTLFQQLGGSDFSSMDGGLRWHASTSQSNGSLASRIQMNDSPSNDIANIAHGPASRFPSPPLRVNSVRPATNDASLIPPVEVLSQPPESSPPTPTSLATTLEPVDVYSPTSFTQMMNATTSKTSQFPIPPTVATNAASREPMESFPSFAGVHPMTRNLQPSPSAVAAMDPLVARRGHLQAISANIANLASPLPPPSSQSSSPDSSSVTQANDNTTTHQSSQPQHSATPIVLRHPYSANQSSGRMELSIDDTMMDRNDSSLALVPSPTTLSQEYQTQSRVISEAAQSINSALNAVHRAQIDSENALALQIRTFEEQRAAFEQTKRAEEATLHQELQELRQKREELNAKEASLASLEKESKAREVARKAMLAKRQAQEEEKRAAEAKRTQEVQEQITIAMNELKEVEALRAQGRLGPLASEAVPDDLPTESHEGMNEEEIAVIRSRNDLLRAVKHLRRMHTDKVQKLEESNRALRRLGVERKQRETEEAERRRIAEEERLRAHAEGERVRQLLDEKQRQFEAERKRQEVENDREQAQLLVEQQAHAEAQAYGLRRTETTSGQAFEHRSHPEEVSAPQQQGITDITRIRASREANSHSPGAANAMSVDEDGRAFTSHHTVPLSDIYTSPGGSQGTTSQSKQKKDGLVSGGVMLGAPTPKTGGGHLPPKTSAKPPSLSSSDRVAENPLNPARTSPPISVSVEDGHRSSFPAQFASDIRPTPDRKFALSRTPKSQTLLDATNGGSQELSIGPVPGVSPTQQNVNLRHLKRSRGRIEENDSGDRSVKSAKSEENSSPSLKREEHDDQSRELVQASFSTNPLASLPPRPAVIPPPRPRMSRKHAPPASQADPSSSYPTESKQLSSAKGAAEVISEQPREALSRGNPSSQAMNTPVQLPVAAEATNPLLLGLVYPEPQSTESRIQDHAENYDTTSSEPASATLPHELDGEDPSRSNRRFSDEPRRARNVNSSRRLSDHHSPSLVLSQSTLASPTQPHRLIDSWRPQNPSNGPRVEPMRATSPTTGRKRSSEFNNNEHGHRARRQRGDAWVAHDHDRDRVDSYRPHWDRRLDSEPDERHAAYRAPASPPLRSYPSDIPRATYDNRTYVPPLSEEPRALTPRWEPSYRRPENDDPYQRYQPSAPSYNTMADQHHTDDARVGQTYEPMTEERVDVQPDLLARMSNTQRFPFSTNARGRGRAEPSRGRGDFGRGRGRGVVRSGPALLTRLTSGPSSSSLGDRLT